MLLHLGDHEKHMDPILSQGSKLKPINQDSVVQHCHIFVEA